MPKLRAAIYKRISDDTEGLELGVARQDEDCLSLCASHDYTVVDVFCDNDISASTLSRKPRPGYDAMRAGVMAGKYDVIVTYTNSRLTRRPLELEDWIKLHEKFGIIVNTVASGRDDLSTADGRMVARIKASVDAAEAERTGERVRRALVQRREGGVPHNGFPRFGYTYTTEAGYTPHPTEAALLKDAYERVVDGESFRSIANKWNMAGVTARRGGLWSGQSVRLMMDNGFAAGLIREHSRKTDSTSMKSYDIQREGAHVAIISNNLWVAYNSRREANASDSPRRATPVRALSGLLVCGHHEEPVKMFAANDGGRALSWRCPRWRDSKAHAYITINNAYAEAEILTWIQDIVGEGVNVDAEAAQIAKGRQAQVDTASVEAEIKRLKAKRLKLSSDALEDLIDPEDARELNQQIKEALAEAEARLKSLAATVTVAGVDRLRAFTTLAEEWDRFTPADHRDALATVLRYAVVVPAPKGQRCTLRMVETFED